MSSSWHELLRRRGGGGSSMLYEGVIAQDASSVSDQILVTVIAFDKELTWGPAPFMPRVEPDGADVAIVLPQDGDRAVIGLAATDTPGEPAVWILGWWPD